MSLIKLQLVPGALYTLLLCLIGGIHPVLAQFEQPVSRTHPDVPALSTVETRTLPSLNNAELRTRNVARKGQPIRFAEPLAVDITPANSGTWQTLSNGARMWRLRLVSRTAFTLNLGFSRFQMPPDGKLFVYTPGYTTLVRPFKASDNETHGQLWTPVVPGEEVVIELNVPAAQEDQVDLRLAFVNHDFLGFDNVMADKVASGSCNLDVVCSNTDGFPEVNPWRDQIRSVARLVIGGVAVCSGGALNNTALDSKPYVGTANHCGVTAANEASVMAFWNYENSTCRPPGSMASGDPGDGMLTQFSTGSILRTSCIDSDMTLLELDDPLDPAFDVFLAGWDRQDVAPTSAVTIHHPSVDEKRISFENDPTLFADDMGMPDPAGNFIMIPDWDLGTTEGGSSGSPLFNPAGLMVGQLNGGFAACGNDELDIYGRFFVAWTECNLQPFLDPTSSGALTLPGMNPVLPVELVSFDGRFHEGDIQLNWSTASETNNAGFEVQKQFGETFLKIGYVDGFGTTTETQHYTYRFETPDVGTHNFRLKQIDFDGAFEYSPTLNIQVGVPTEYELSAAYPNPFNPTTRFTLAVASKQSVHISIFDMTGRKVNVIHDGVLEADIPHAFTFSSGILPSGLYILRVEGQTFSTSQQLVLLK